MKLKHTFYTIPLLILLFAWGTAPFAQGQNNLLQTLQEKDVAFNQGFSATLTFTHPTVYFDFSQGQTYQNLHITSDGSQRALISENSFSKEFSYRQESAPGYQNGDFGLEKELFLWRTQHKIGYDGPSLNQSLRTDEMVTIEANGTVIPGEGYPMQLRYAIGNGNNLFEFDQALLALGRGFSKHLNEQKAVETLSSGLLMGTFSGFYGLSQPGTWVLWVNPAQDYLVIAATFTPQFGNRASVTVNPKALENGGNPMRSGGKLLGREGVILFSLIDGFNYSVKAALETLSAAPDLQLIDQARSEADQLPQGGEILDYTSGNLNRTDIE